MNNNTVILTVKQRKVLLSLVRSLIKEENKDFIYNPSTFNYESLKRAMLVYQDVYKNIEVTLDGLNSYDFDNLKENIPCFIANIRTNLSW